MKERWEILADLINTNNLSVIVEVGISKGINAHNVLKLCLGIKSYYLVDISFDVFDQTLFEGYEQKIIKIQLPSIEAARLVSTPVDLVFIDANHHYTHVIEDINAWWPMVKPNGILCGHDYIESFHEGVKRAVCKIFEKVNLEDDAIDNGETKIWWIQK